MRYDLVAVVSSVLLMDGVNIKWKARVKVVYRGKKKNTEALVKRCLWIALLLLMDFA